jgi:hypothetical protein
METTRRWSALLWHAIEEEDEEEEKKKEEEKKTSIS